MWCRVSVHTHKNSTAAPSVLPSYGFVFFFVCSRPYTTLSICFVLSCCTHGVCEGFFGNIYIYALRLLLLLLLRFFFLSTILPHQFSDVNRFYIASDNELMIDLLKGEINFLKSAWQNLLGRPLLTLVLKTVHLGRSNALLYPSCLPHSLSLSLSLSLSFSSPHKLSFTNTPTISVLPLLSSVCPVVCSILFSHLHPLRARPTHPVHSSLPPPPTPLVVDF